ncbi:MAG: radical SAM protein [Abditibacteriaceae bacterium]
MKNLQPRNYLIEEYTTTVCPQCFAEGAHSSDEADVWKDGMLVSHDGSIWMRRFCAKHGETESLYEENAELWHARSGWSTPTSQITPDRADNFAAFPQGYQNGLPASHGQHTCILLLNVTERCNYSCPTCYAGALSPGAPSPRPEHPSIAEIHHTVETMLAREGGKLGVLMLSGGEPTVREDLPQIIDSLSDLNITRIVINTNGRRIARDDKFVEFLRQNRTRIEVYLQFDGVLPETYLALRGEDVTAEKLLALQRMESAGIFTTLVATIQRGVNENELGALVETGLNAPHCAGLMLQPVFGSGRSLPFDPQSRTTPTGVLQRIGEQTNGIVSAADFIPLPCSHRDCCDITYLLRTGEDAWKSLPNLIGRDELKKWIHLVSNTIGFDNVGEAAASMLKSGVLQRVFSESQKVSAPALASDIWNMCQCSPGLSGTMNYMRHMIKGSSKQDDMEAAAESTFRITVKMFMDSHTFHSARIRQCCVHTGTFEDDPKRYSFCWRWLFDDAKDAPGLFQIEDRTNVGTRPAVSA